MDRTKDTAVFIVRVAFRRYPQFIVSLCSFIYFHRILGKYSLLSVYLTCVYKTERKKKLHSVDNIFEFKKKKNKTVHTWYLMHANIQITRNKRRRNRSEGLPLKMKFERIFLIWKTHTFWTIILLEISTDYIYNVSTWNIFERVFRTQRTLGPKIPKLVSRTLSKSCWNSSSGRGWNRSGTEWEIGKIGKNRERSGVENAVSFVTPSVSLRFGNRCGNSERGMEGVTD